MSPEVPCGWQRRPGPPSPPSPAPPLRLAWVAGVIVIISSVIIAATAIQPFNIIAIKETKVGGVEWVRRV